MNTNNQTVVVIPAYEPPETLLNLSKEITEAGYRLLVVNDGSSMECRTIWNRLEKQGAKVLHHDINQGKGAALKTAWNYIKTHSYLNIKNIVTMDADGQHLVSDLEPLVAESGRNPGSLVLGVREFTREVPFKSRAGNKITRTVFFLTSGSRISDTQTGFRVFSADLLEKMSDIPGSRYEYEMNVLTACVREKIPVREVPIKTVYIDQENSTSHFRAVRDSIRIYGELLCFTGSALLSFLADYVLFLALMVLTGGFAHSLILSNVGARLLSGGLNYTMNTRVFGDRQPVRRTLTKYVALASGILAGNTLVLSVLTHFAGIPPMAAKILTECLFFIISYLVQSLFIFRREYGVDFREAPSEKAGLPGLISRYFYN